MGVFELAYGYNKLQFHLDDEIKIDRIEPIEISCAQDPIHELVNALEDPVDGTKLADFASARTVAIAINDKTRPVPHEYILPVLVKKLIEIGISPDAIRFYIATGTHLPMRAEEYNKIVPKEIVQRFNIVSHDCDNHHNLIKIGVTKQGTPVTVNREYYESELKIVVGNIEPHHFMGFSGGAKSASIGLCSRETINKNHAFLLNPASCVGTYETNPMRMDVEEIGDMIHVHLAFNVILNESKQIVQAFAGTPRNVMHNAIPVSKKLCQVQVPQKYDLVIASVGGAPKDINLYQAQKALTHAAMITRDNGIVILAAACAEGVGSDSFEKFMKNIETPDQVFEQFSKIGFQIGPHKAFQIARQAIRIKMILISELPADKVYKSMLIPANSIEEALNSSMKELAFPVQVAFMPRATNTIPLIGQQ